MKLTNLILSALAAVFTMVSCSKDLQTQDTTLKTVEVSLENIVLTKGLAGDKINSGDHVKVKNFKIFLTDGSYSPGYSAKNADGTPATFYFDASSDLSQVKQFHFVDHKCTKIVVVANVDPDITFQDIVNFNIPIAEQQDQNTLFLYGEKDLVATGKTHTVEGETKYTEVYEAKVLLKPTIARVEVDGFVTSFSPSPKFDKVSVTALAFQHYFPTMTTNTTGGKLHIAGSGNHVLPIADLDDESQVFGWFNGSSSNGWFIDRFNPALDMTPQDNKADTPNKLAYHFYAGEIVPQMMITVVVNDASPAYLYAKAFKVGNEYLTQLEPGKIYRMKAAGEVANDGSIEIPDDLTPIQRCLEIEVTVDSWKVDLIAPEF